MTEKSKLTARAMDSIKLGRVDVISEGEPIHDRTTEGNYACNAPVKHCQSLTFHFVPQDSQRSYLGVLWVYAPTEEELAGA
jgi:hypothetical protein